jgi:Cof subfamily protein (haloacid dehalogenase superfamily)
VRFKLIAFDLDGTVLHDDKTLGAETLCALDAAAEAGALIVPATGRIYGGVPEALRLRSFARYFITINGAQLYDAQRGEVIARAEIPNDLALRLTDYMAGLDVLYDCYKDDWGYVSGSLYERAADYITDPGILALFRRTRTQVPDLRSYLREDGGSVQKLQMHFRNLRERRRQLELLPQLFPEIAVSTSVGTNIELNIRQANKGDALRALCAHLEIPLSETLAFGDGTNDLSMIRAAGLGVAMGNADFAVAAAADTVCDSNERDGVAKFIEKLLAQ